MTIFFTTSTHSLVLDSNVFLLIYIFLYSVSYLNIAVTMLFLWRHTFEDLLVYLPCFLFLIIVAVICLLITHSCLHRVLQTYECSGKMLKKGEKFSFRMILLLKGCQKKKHLEKCMYNSHKPVDQTVTLKSTY